MSATESGAGERLIRAERRRQIEAEGYDTEHDREHGGFALSQAAYCYKAHGLLPPGTLPDQWPWDRESWKPRDPISNLVRAGALYLAAADLDYPSASEGAQRCAALLDASITRLAPATPDADDASEHCGDMAAHPPHEHRTPAYTGEWKRCEGSVPAASTDASGALSEALHRAFHDNWHPGVPLNLSAPDSVIWQKQAAAVERIVAARESAAATRADEAEAELSNVQHDYDARGERLWRLAALTGYVPTESDNDATAELVIADALAAATRARAEERERIAQAIERELLDHGDDYLAALKPFTVAARIARGDA